MIEPSRFFARRWVRILAALLVAVALFVIYDAWRAREESALAANAAIEITYVGLPDTLHKLGVLAPGFDVDKEGSVLVVPGSGGLAMIDQDRDLWREAAGGRRFDSAAFDGTTILATSGGFFGRINDQGRFDEGVPLPYNAARLFRSADPGVVYLAGGYLGEWRLYRFEEQGRYRIVLATDAEIVGAVDGNGAVWVATRARLLKLDSRGTHVAFIAPHDPPFGFISSLALTPNGDPLVATDKAVWIVNPRGEANTLINNAGGELRQLGRRTYVLDRRRELLFYFTDGRQGGD